MAKYRERSTTITATEWVRCARIVIDIPHNQAVPEITFWEEVVRDDGATVTTAPRATLWNDGTLIVRAPDDLEVQRVNPDTLQPRNKTISMGEIYEILQSVYLHAAQERDNKG